MKRVWGAFWTIEALIGVNALWSTWKLSSESKNVFFLGMSKSKLALCTGLLVLIMLCLMAAVFSFLKKVTVFSSGKASGSASYILTFALILGSIFLTPPVGKTALERSLLERLLPSAYWALSFVLLSFLLLIIQNYLEIWKYQISSVPALICGVVLFLLMGAGIFYAISTGTGLDPISGTFYRQGVSLLEGQLIVPLLFLYPLVPLFHFLSPKITGKKAEISLTIVSCVLVWAAAVWFWQTTVFEGRSYFAPALRLPNNNFYPASDAENYDLLAQSILLGNGFRNGMTVVRPLYAAFLALLHLIFGNDYMMLTNGQILFLALIPVFIFLIAKNMKFTAAGLAAAAWIIWREIYSIRLSPLVQVSNSRLLMSDLPAMLLVALIILLTVKWHRLDREETRSLLCGGMIGTAMLLRTQCFVLIPVLWLVFLCSAKKPSKKWLSVLCSLLGLLIVYAPWIVWGKIYPNTTANADVTEDQYLLSLYRKAIGEEQSNKDLFHLITENPGKTIQTVSSHFLNNEISSLLVLPLRITKPEEAEQLFYEEDLFWYRENARETIENNISLVVIYLLLISFGTISAVRKNGFGGLIPLLFHFVYNLGNAFALTSGFRFILPVDWVLLFYFGFGCLAVFDFIRRVLLSDAKPESQKVSENTLEISEEAASLPAQKVAGSDNITTIMNTTQPVLVEAEQLQNTNSSSRQTWSFITTIILLAVIGSVLPLCDNFIPRKFEPKTMEQIASDWQKLPDRSALNLSNYQDENIVFLEGRAFYPRYYKAGDGDSGGSSSAKRDLDYDRIVWMFHDQRVHVLCCPLIEDQVQTMTTTKIPDPMDVLVVGIQREDYVEVLEMRRLAGN